MRLGHDGQRHGIGKMAIVGIVAIVLLGSVIVVGIAVKPSSSNTSIQVSTSNSLTSSTQTSQQGSSTTTGAILFEEDMQVTSVSSSGGVFTGKRVSGSFDKLIVSAPPLPVTYGDNVEIILVYSSLQKLLYDSLGRVVQVSTAGTLISLQNTTFLVHPLPLSLNPRVGDAVHITIDRVLKPVVVALPVTVFNITGVLNADTFRGYLSTGFGCPTPPTEGGAYQACWTYAGQQVTSHLRIILSSNGPGNISAVSVTSITVKEAGFKVVTIQPALPQSFGSSSATKLGQSIVIDETIVLDIPTVDYVGPLTFYIAISAA